MKASTTVKRACALLALLLVFGVFGIVGAEPASAAPYTIQRSSDEIVITSTRRTEDQTHVTMIVTLHRDGNWIFRINAHCTARTRKFVTATADVWSGGTGHSWAFGSGGKRRVESGEWDEWQTSGWSPLLAGQWDNVLNDPFLEAQLDIDVRRVP